VFFYTFEEKRMLHLNFSPFPILESERLRFRKLTNTDAPEIIELRGNPETMQFIPRPLVTDTESALAHIKMINDKIDENSDINWAVTEKGSEKCIGIMGFYRTQPEHFRTELGYMITKEHWGKGYVTEAVKIILDYAFNTLNFHSIEAVIDSRHKASERVLQKVGFQKEAHFKENFFYNNEFTDTVIYSLLKKNFMKKLNAQEILDKLQDFPNWNFFNNGIEKHFIFKDFVTTMQVMNAIAEIAESQNHHPEWSNVYNKLHIRLTTHDCDGVSDKDFELAEAIEKIIAKHF
jgi:[ribosomal protein S5]-alanine N-acetyltransferase